MNYSMIIFILGHLLRYEAIFMLLPTLTGFIYGEQESVAFLCVSLVTFLLGTVLSCKTVKNKQLFTKDGSITVAFGWIILTIFVSPQPTTNCI